MFKCCEEKIKAMHDQLDYKLTETKEGIQIDVAPKDPKKTASFKALVKSCQEFCGC